jgi:peptide/nickel transport system substrate-binding protein
MIRPGVGPTNRGGTLTRRRRTGVAIAVLISVALLGAGCTGGKAASDAAVARGPAAAVLVNQINPVAYADLKAGGTLNYPLQAPIANFNSYQLDGYNDNVRTLMSTMLPALFTVSSTNQFTHNPDYLTGEPKVATTPAQTITYEINPKAKWSDGTPISYQDFVAQWQALNGSDPNFTIATSGDYGDIASVARGAGDQEVIVTLKAGVVDSDWRGLFSPLYPLSALSTAAAFNTGWKDKPLLSAGPFMFQSATANSYTLVRNPGWWGRAPKLASVVFKVLPTLDTSISALQSHQIDVQDIGQDLTTFDQVKAFPGIVTRHAGGPDVRAITLNGARPQLADVRVRQALAMAIDRDAIANAELAPFGITKATAPDDHIFLADETGYQDNSGAIGKYDPVAAGKLLDSAGWVDNPTTHVRAKAGKPLQINFVIPDKIAVNLSEAQLVQAQLAKIDVKVNIVRVNGAMMVNQYVRPGNYDFTAFAWLGGNFPISEAASIYEPEQPGNDWQQNFSHVSVAAVGTLFQQAENNLDQAAANAAANQADALIWQNVLTLPLYQRPDVWAVNAKLANFGAFGFATIDWTDVGFTS